MGVVRGGQLRGPNPLTENCQTECTVRTERAGKGGSLRAGDGAMHRAPSRGHSNNSSALNVRGAGLGAPSDPPFPVGSVVSVHSVLRTDRPYQQLCLRAPIPPRNHSSTEFFGTASGCGLARGALWFTVRSAPSC